MGSAVAKADNVVAHVEHTAGSQWGANTGASTVDSEKEYYNNDASAAWAGAAYCKFSFTLPSGHKVTRATLTYHIVQGGSQGRNDIIYYMKPGFDLDWNNFAGQTGTDLRYASNRAGKAVESAPTGGTGERMNLSQDVTAAVQAIASAGQNFILFQWTGNAGGAQLYGKGSSHWPYLAIETEYDTSISLSFSEKSRTADITEVNFVEPILNKRNIPSYAHIVFTSNKPSVARVNPLTGDVFLMDGTLSTDPVTITATAYDSNNGVIASDSYQLIIKTVDDAEFRTEGNKSTAWVNGKFGTRKVEAVPNITMYTGNIDVAKDITLVREVEGYKVATTLAGDGWRDARFAADGVTPVEGTYYMFKPEANGKLKVEGLMISNTGVMFVDANNITQNLLNPVPSFSSASSLVTIEQELTADHTYYLFGVNPYYCSTDRKISENNGVIGHTDFSDDFWNVQSTTGVVTVEQNQTLTMMFKLHTKNNPSNPGGDGDDDNFLLHINDNGEELFLRGDANANAGAGGKMDARYSILEAGYEGVYTKMDNADVKLTVSRNGNAITATVMITCTDGTVYAKQQMLTANNEWGNITAQVHPLGSYFTDFKAFKSAGWNVFELHSFEFTSDYRYDFVSLVYHDGNFYDATDDLKTPLNSNRLSVTDNGNTVTIKQNLVGEVPGITYKVDPYGDVDHVNAGPDGALTIDPAKGGAYVVTASRGNLSARYILTIPYDTHKWNFGPDNSEPSMTEIEGKKAQYDVEWRFNARLKQKDGTTGYMNSYSHPLICGKNAINGDNVLYIKNSEGMLFNTTSGNALGYSVTQKEGMDLDGMKAAKLAEKQAALMASQEYQSMSAEQQAAALAAVEVTPQEINRILYEMYANTDESTVENPTDMWVGYKDTEITIPYAKAGQFVKLHWSRYTWNAKSGGNGSDFRATNLLDLDGKDVSTSFRITGYQGTYTNPEGNYIFRVKENGPVTIVKDDNGWVSIADIELTNEYSTDLKLIEITKESEGLGDPIKEDLTDKPISLTSNGMTDAERHFSCYAGQTKSANAKSSVISVDTGNSGANVDVEETLWFTSPRGAQYNKFIVKSDRNSGHGNVKLTEKVMTDTGDYTIDRLDAWIAVGTVTPQQYPRTWDFTAQNMDYAGASKTLMMNTNGNNAYGEWNTVGDETVSYANKNITKDPDMYLHTYNAEGGPKPLFADCSELTAGENTFPEAIGIGVGAASPTEADNIKLTGEALTGVMTITVPMLSVGDYVYVMANKAPTATVQSYSLNENKYTEAEGANTSTQDAKYLGEGVYGFKVDAGNNVNMTITFDDAADIYKLGVSNIEKTFDKYGFSTESRDKNIDYSFISAPAYAITESEFTYNYDKVSVSPTEKFGITPAGQGVMLYKEELANDKSPLFYAGNNLMDGTTNLPAADNTLAGKNQLVAQLTAGDIAQYQTNGDDVDCDAFVLTYIYSTYSSSEKNDKATNQDLGTDAFFRVKGSIAAPANKAYLLIPSENLPKALWDGGNGNGTAGAVKNVVRINFGEEDNDDTPTVIEGVNIADTDGSDNGTWYNLSGQKLNGKPASKGVYIINGKKVMVK